MPIPADRETKGTRMTTNIYRIPIKWATTTRDGECLVEKHWVVTPNNEILLWNGTSPQCNRDSVIVDGWLSLWQSCSTRFIPAVYLGHREGDGRYTLAMRYTSGLWEEWKDRENA